MSSSAHGHFVWHDLITTDIPQAISFYTKLIGWETQPFDPEGKYTMWVGKEGPIGGVGQAPEGTPPYWRVYIGTDDIAATVYEAQQLGGSVVTPVTDISNGGKWAVLRDPQNNEFGVYWTADAKAPVLKLQPGEFHWHELATHDYKSVFDFYQKLFGWERGVEHDMGGTGMYALFTNSARPQGMGGIYNKPATLLRGGWNTYTQVKDAKKSALAIVKAGGTNLHEPMQVPGGSWVVKFADPQGVPHAVISTDVASMQSAEKEPAAAKPRAKKTAIKSKTVAKKTASKTLAKRSSKKAKDRQAEKSASKKDKKKSKDKKLDKKKLKKLEKKEAKKQKKGKKKK